MDYLDSLFKKLALRAQAVHLNYDLKKSSWEAWIEIDYSHRTNMHKPIVQRLIERDSRRPTKRDMRKDLLWSLIETFLPESYVEESRNKLFGEIDQGVKRLERSLPLDGRLRSNLSY